jgi:hypothetical protein
VWEPPLEKDALPGLSEKGRGRETSSLPTSMKGKGQRAGRGSERGKGGSAYT